MNMLIIQMWSAKQKLLKIHILLIGVTFSALFKIMLKIVVCGKWVIISSLCNSAFSPCPLYP